LLEPAPLCHQRIGGNESRCGAGNKDAEENAENICFHKVQKLCGMRQQFHGRVKREAGDASLNPEIRIPEFRKKPETRRPKRAPVHRRAHRTSDFGILSDFGFRILGFITRNNRCFDASWVSQLNKAYSPLIVSWHAETGLHPA
jgi:hypothetical protein